MIIRLLSIAEVQKIKRPSLISQHLLESEHLKKIAAANVLCESYLCSSLQVMSPTDDKNWMTKLMIRSRMIS